MALEHDSGAFIFFRGLKSTATRSVMPTAFFCVLVGFAFGDFSSALGQMYLTGGSFSGSSAEAIRTF